MTSTTPTLDRYLSPTAVARLAEQYDISGLEAAWLKGDYGTLYSQDSCECVGQATREQAIESYEESYEGFVNVELAEENRIKGIPLDRGLLSVWVTP